ncbi:hypothetical protein K440DRAFT_661523 [Wilcoxina mikolae CBS 423.85]|nr:hypothetical protein K440DRAFT_661523 [Wilcoxina mikolae CBS 423.85]
MPWHLVAMLFLVHLPLVLVRVASWKKGQIVCLVVAFFDAITTTQAYVSTKLDPAKVMVWTPILLVIDVGAVLQVFILVVEKYGARFPFLRHIMHAHPSPQTDESFVNPFLLLENWGSRSNAASRNPSSHHQDGQSESGDQPKNGTAQDIPWAELLIATIALILFFVIIALQIIGLIAAVRARSVENLTVPWCSPVFNVFAFAVQDASCNLYAVEQNRNGGIACIKLPATLQHRWSIATEVTVALSLFLQFIDFWILLCVNSKFKKLRQAKMKRPWFTMFFGLGVLLTVLILSILQAYMLPPGMSKDVLVANEAETEFLCRGTLTPPGLRGSNIGWWDGLMQSWGCAWYGCP